MKIPGLWRVRHFYCRLKERRIDWSLYKQAKTKINVEISSRTESARLKVLKNWVTWKYKNKKVTNGVNLIGYAKGDFGLAEHLRLVTNAINTTSIPFCVNDTKDPGGHTQSNESISRFITKGKPYKVNLFCYNACEIVDHFKSYEGEISLKKHYNIGYGYWELSEFPVVWREQNSYLNEIWAPSLFIKEVIEKSTTLPVYHMPIPVDFEIPVGYSRTYFNLPTDKFMFLFTFDLSSHVARKNPQAVINAFIKAFPVEKNDKVCLVIKIHKIKNNPDHIFKLNELTKQISFDPRIIIFDEILDRSSILGLINVSDVYVSLHRSEGFGLGMAEAMKMGKVVIATNYSGNKDFMNEENSCPVNYRLVRVGEMEYALVENGAVWADPDVDHAVYYMKKVYEDRAFAQKIGAVAKNYINEYRNFETIGKNYLRRLREIS
jgi:glycosyltransferase involved in cell wall biosynthesis